MMKQSNIDHLRLCALWYGYGQADAGSEVDANAFAAHYADLVTAMEEGRTSFLPSIQDAWKAYTGQT